MTSSLDVDKDLVRVGLDVVESSEDARSAKELASVAQAAEYEHSFSERLVLVIKSMNC